MDGKSAKSIESILQAYDEKQRVLRQEMEARAEQRRQFLDQFAGHIQRVIRPVMEEAAELLRRSGHEYEIVENEAALQLESSAAGERRRLDEAVALRIFPNGERPTDPRNDERTGWPHVAFLVHPTKNVILVHESAMMPGVGGPSGTAGEYSLEQVTRQVAERHLISVLARAMGIGRVKRSARVRGFVRRHRHDEEIIPAAFKYLAR